eukprot:13224882-Ditylum_brightwellii.AAC.1
MSDNEESSPIFEKTLMNWVITIGSLDASSVVAAIFAVAAASTAIVVAILLKGGKYAIDLNNEDAIKHDNNLLK